MTHPNYPLSDPLPHAFYARDTALVARELLGCLLVHRVAGAARVGRIVEVEAYLGAHDLAAHSAKGLTPRTRVMFGPPGHAYVYLIYGIHHCMNVVTEPVGNGAAVLIRALEPVQNLVERTNGPGLLCKAMGIDRSHNTIDLTGQALFLAPPALPVATSIVTRPRIGVGYAGDWAQRPLRYYLKGSRCISKP